MLPSPLNLAPSAPSFSHTPAVWGHFPRSSDLDADQCAVDLSWTPTGKDLKQKLKPKKRVRRKRPGTLIAATSAQMEDVSSPKQGMAMANHWSLHYFRFISRWPLLSWKVTPCATDFHECFIDLNLCYFTNSSTSKFVDFSCHFGWVFRLPQRSHLGPPHQLHEPLLPTLNSHFRCFFANEGLLAITMFFHVNGEIGY